MLELKLVSAAGEVIASACREGELALFVKREYEEGDAFVLSGGKHLWVQLDSSVPAGEVFCPEGRMTWRIPFGEHRLAYNPVAFTGELHVITAREMSAAEVSSLRCLSRNPSDLRGDTDFFPHSVANVETRNESCFAARNVIDGFTTNTSHGSWPFQSWGIGIRTDAWCEIDLGRRVLAEKFAVVLRADFPHDAWWEKAKLIIDDEKTMEISLIKSGDRQWIVPDQPVEMRKLRITELIKADDPSPFPALTQLEIYGKDLQ